MQTNGNHRLCADGRAACHRAQERVNIAHSIGIRYRADWFGLFVGFSPCSKILLRQWGKVKGRDWLARTRPHVKASIRLSRVGTYLLCWVGMFRLMLLRNNGVAQNDKISVGRRKMFKCVKMAREAEPSRMGRRFRKQTGGVEPC